MLKKVFLSILLVVFLGSFMAAANYLPLSVGNEYHYDIFDMVRNVVGHVDNQIVTSATAGGWTYYKNSNFLGEEIWLTEDEIGNVGFYTSYGPSLLYNFSAGDGNSWTIYLDGENFYYGATATISFLSGTITVPAGTFSNPVRITYDVPDDAPVGTILKQYFIEGVGLVKEVRKDINGLVKSIELKRAVVNGHVYGVDENNGGDVESGNGSLEVKVSTNKFNYTLHYRSRGAEQGPGNYADIKVKISITNNTGTAININRLNGQKYDIKVYDQNGEVIYDWANGRFFTQAAENTTINPGQTLTYTETISVKFPDQGIYQVEMETAGNIKFSGKVAISCVIPLYNNN